MKLQEILHKMEFCQNAIDWVGDRTPKEAWLECPNGAWMGWIFWYAAEVSKTYLIEHYRDVRAVAFKYERLISDLNSRDEEVLEINLEYANKLRDMRSWQAANDALNQSFKHFLKEEKRRST
jgi:hypothetical protein